MGDCRYVIDRPCDHSISRPTDLCRAGFAEVVLPYALADLAIHHTDPIVCTLLSRQVSSSTCSHPPVFIHLTSSTCHNACALIHVFSSTCPHPRVLIHMSSSTCSHPLALFHVSSCLQGVIFNIRTWCPYLRQVCQLLTNVPYAP